MLPNLLRDLKDRGYRFVQVVYRPGAPAQSLVDGPPGVPLTERVISHLQTPILSGQHVLDPSSGPMCTSGRTISGDDEQP